MYNEDGSELTDHDRYLLKVKTQLVGTWDIQSMNIEYVGGGYDVIQKFSKIVFNADNSMRYYKDGYPANKGYYKIDDYKITCYTEDYYDMVITYQIEDIQSGYLEETGFSYMEKTSITASTVVASGGITLKKETNNQ